MNSLTKDQKDNNLHLPGKEQDVVGIYAFLLGSPYALFILIFSQLIPSPASGREQSQYKLAQVEVSWGKAKTKSFLADIMDKAELVNVLLKVAGMTPTFFYVTILSKCHVAFVQLFIC